MRQLDATRVGRENDAIGRRRAGIILFFPFSKCRQRFAQRDSIVVRIPRPRIVRENPSNRALNSQTGPTRPFGNRHFPKTRRSTLASCRLRSFRPRRVHVRFKSIRFRDRPVARVPPQTPCQWPDGKHGRDVPENAANDRETMTRIDEPGRACTAYGLR